MRTEATGTEAQGANSAKATKHAHRSHTQAPKPKAPKPPSMRTEATLRHQSHCQAQKPPGRCDDHMVFSVKGEVPHSPHMYAVASCNYHRRCALRLHLCHALSAQRRRHQGGECTSSKDLDPVVSSVGEDARCSCSMLFTLAAGLSINNTIRGDRWHCQQW